MQDFIADQIA